jgi:ADP-heptose:LPS heptosyltransferase
MVLGRGLNVVVTGNDSDRDKIAHIKGLVGNLRLPKSEPHDNQIAATGRLEVFTGQSLQAFSALIGMSRGLAAIDSLAIHLASAHQIPTLAIFGPSGERNWSPWRTRSVIVQNSELFPCRPCGQDGCGGGKISACLTAVSADQLWSAATKVFDL